MFRMVNSIRSAVAALLFACLMGCGSDTYKGPVALTEGDLPQAIRTAFAEAPEATKGMAEKAVSLFEGEKYPESMSQFRQICDLVELTDERRQVASRCLITITAKIKEAAESQDDKSAKKYIKYNQVNK
jgi:hypothetical protein